jgi:hypothetical protein
MPPIAVIDAFLGASGLRGLGEAELLRGGANNRVYRVPAAGRLISGAGDGVLKIYFRRENDAWDRFAAETSFYHHAASRAAEFLCAPRAWSAELRAGCFEWVDGDSFASGGIMEAEVARAAEFVRQLQQGREGAVLGAGAESVFSGPEHATLMAGRLQRLRDLEVTDDLSAEAKRFVLEQLDPRWRGMEERVRSLGRLAPDQRCVSPSDFGFHNALRRASGQICFFDFEYAGMDDPAKLVADFFWQPAVPVPWDLGAGFLEAVGDSLGPSDLLRARVRTLFPLFGLKWCCIVLNEFVREERARRSFSLGAEQTEARRLGQLAKAQRMLRRVDEALTANPWG